MSSQMPLISVIVPIYNTEKYLSQCIDSIIDQTYKNLEIILVDDGSTDSCPEICDKYAESDSRIIVVHKKNGGLIAARKTGLESAHGEYVAYVDSDDWINENMYMEMYNNGIVYDSELVITAITRVLPDGKCFEEKSPLKNKLYDRNDILNEVFPVISDTSRFFTWGISLTIPIFLFKMSFLKPVLFSVDERIKMGEDTATTLPCILSAKSLAVVSGCFYYYRQSENSMKRTAKKNEYVSTFLLYDHLCRYINKYQLQEIMQAKVAEHTLKTLLISSFNLFIDNDKGEIEIYHIKKGSRVAIYGAGIYGAEIYNRIKETEFCDVVLWADSNYDSYSDIISSPDSLKSDNYDYIILALSFYKSRMAVKEKLLKMGISPSKIADIDTDYINDKYLNEIICKVKKENME